VRTPANGPLQALWLAIRSTAIQVSAFCEPSRPDGHAELPCRCLVIIASSICIGESCQHGCVMPFPQLRRFTGIQRDGRRQR